MRQERCRKILLVDGMSESGKSTVGNYLELCGYTRIKTKTLLERLKSEDGSPLHRSVYFDYNMLNNPTVFLTRLVTELATAIAQISGPIVVENVTYPEVYTAIHKRFPDQVILVFLELSEEARIKRQMKRAGVTREEAQRLLLPRDVRRQLVGTPTLAEKADFLIHNSGSVKDLHISLNHLIKSGNDE